MFYRSSPTNLLIGITSDGVCMQRPCKIVMRRYNYVLQPSFGFWKTKDKLNSLDCLVSLIWIEFKFRRKKFIDWLFDDQIGLIQFKVNICAWHLNYKVII